ncbi:hypothetical protein ACQP3F_29560, partial [Escherichia coli]
SSGYTSTWDVSCQATTQKESDSMFCFASIYEEYVLFLFKCKVIFEIIILEICFLENVSCQEATCEMD